MIPYPFFYQLALIALVWLFLMLPYAWSSQRTLCQSPPTLPTPQAPVRAHSVGGPSSQTPLRRL